MKILSPRDLQKFSEIREYLHVKHQGRVSATALMLERDDKVRSVHTK